MRAVSKTMISLNVITDVAVVAYLGVSRYLSSLDQQPISSPSHEVNAWLGAAASILASVWIASRVGGEVVSRGKTTAAGLAEEKVEREKIKEAVAEYKLDLTERRARVNTEITVLTLKVEALEKRANKVEMKHDRLRGEFDRLTGLVAPILRDADLDLTRADAVSKIIGAAYSFPEESTNSGNGA